MSLKQRWRLILDGDRPGAENMALDEAMLDDFVLGRTPPTLRLYGWRPAALSIGYAQSLEDVDLEACRRDGLDVVRRPTGGRAVLHRGERTYAVVAGPEQGFPDSVAGSYRMITTAIARGLTTLGIEAELTPGARTRASGASCFATATLADLTVGGLKLVGSAQTRRAGCFLQHGSILTSQQGAEVANYLKSGAAPRGTTNLEASLGRQTGTSELDRALIAAMAQAFDADFQQ